jgi:phosphate transport system substrate-binding protein
MRFPALLAAAFSFFSLLPFAAKADAVRIVGSDLLEGSLRPEFEQFAKKADLKLAFDMRGSRLGMEALGKSQADIALLVFNSEDARPGPEFSTAVIGYLTSVVVVPADVSLTQITYGQLAGVFGLRELSNFRRWSEIGALGEWAPRAISAMALRRTTGLSLDLFRYGVLQTPELKPTVALLDSVDDAYTRLRGEEGGIAILPAAPPAGSKLKVLSLAKAANEVAYPPTAENLHTGDYPLRLSVYVVFRKGEAVRPRLGLIIRHLLSDEAEPALQAAGVTRLPVQARNQLVFDLESM